MIHLLINEMLKAISHLKTGKFVGNDCLSAESFKYTDKSICVFLCVLFNSILYHSYLPSKLMDTIIVPIVEDKKGDLGSKNTFRPIALTTIMSKLFQILILNRYGDLLLSTDNQLGYKKKHATDLCVYTLKQIVLIFLVLIFVFLIFLITGKGVYPDLKTWSIKTISINIKGIYGL